MSIELPEEAWHEIDACLLMGSRVAAMQMFRERTGVGLPAAMDAIADRLQYLRSHVPEHFPQPKNSVEDIILRFESISQSVAAVEALWDGDTFGWFLVLTALVEDSTAQERHYHEHQLAVLQGSTGDLRLFNNEVPPWPEAEIAQRVGEEIVTRFRVPFYFPSPNYPEDDCPRWWEREKGAPCRGCGILLLQEDSCPWRGLCYQCHLAEEKSDAQRVDG
jgi:hypothetical protein